MTQLKSQIEVLNDRLKHLSMISGEIVDNLGPQHQDNEGMSYFKLKTNYKLVNQLIQRRQLDGQKSSLYFRPKCKTSIIISPRS